MDKVVKMEKNGVEKNTLWKHVANKDAMHSVLAIL